MQADSETCANAAGADDRAAAEKACGSENVRTKASICFKAVLLAPSRLILFEVSSDELPIRANSSILSKTNKTRYNFLLSFRIYLYILNFLKTTPKRQPRRCKLNMIDHMAVTYVSNG